LGALAERAALNRAQLEHVIPGVVRERASAQDDTRRGRAFGGP
jgi:hypothetical protein